MTFTKSAIYLAISATTFNLTAFAEEQKNTAINSTDKLETITVTTDFREQNLQKIPTSVSVLTEIEIKQRNAQHLEELIAISPNVNYAGGSQRARYYQIRGIGERSQFQETINPSVGMLIDDVDFTGVGSIATLFDVNQAEVFRGPQGTRFGANAIAGMINITTNAPTEDFEGAMQLTAGNYNTYDLGVALSGPASDAVNYRFAVNKHTSDGFIENVYLDADDTNNRDELSVRGKLAIEASEDLTIDLAGFYFDFKNGYDNFSLDNTRQTYSDEPGFDTQETSALSAKFTYEGFDTATLIAIFSGANSDLAYGYDEDWAYGEYEWMDDEDGYIPDPCITPTGCLADVDGYSSTDHYFRNKDVFTTELRLLSNEGQEIFNGTTSWVTGVYFKQDDEDLTRKYTYLSADFNSENKSQSIALYGELNSQLTERLSLITGLRIENRTADYNNSDAFDDDISDTMTGGKLVLSYQQTEDTLWYGSINRGYKAGGHNTDGSLPEELRSFDPEYLTNYEIGYKVALLDNDAYIRTSVFYMDREDMQVKSSKTILRSDGSSEFISYLGNAATGSNYGVEIEGAWHINNEINVYGSLGLLKTEFNDFINADGQSLDGEEQAHAPNYQFNVGINYQPTDHWLFNLSLDGKDEYYFSDTRYYDGAAIPDADIKSDPVTMLNASISYLQDNWQVKLWGRNLTDEEYENRGFYFPNDPRDGYTPKAYTQLAEPLVFGATLDYQF
ncbi:TonB-dependent receptor [Colwellia echini]|uniref:TonB-dependent receptor plug domain-containing protein n=1 Tax=Colwellia echini TaxID=1982103 RepID=A0ABY3MV65_9GAMM|nr:TonB-dependent receptor [Colwellia echini]TYK65021.1 TonB-dependent receptor plug domain-containing protein [Colwellia echini]